MDNQDTNKDNINVDGQEEVKTYTQDEVMALLQTEADKRVNAALDKQKKKYEKQLSLSGLDEVQRTTAEKDMKIQELQEQLKEFNILQTKNEVVKVLSARNLNPAFADVIAIGEDVEEAQAKIETLDKLFKAAVAEEVKKKLNTGAPKVGSSASEELTKDQFKKLTLGQQSALFKTNPELFKKLSQR